MPWRGGMRATKGATAAAAAAALAQKGENIKRIRRESGAAVSVADAVPGCEERVVHITGER